MIAANNAALIAASPGDSFGTAEASVIAAYVDASA
jgi:hypothetical protein